MDPLSVTASAIAILQLTQSIIIGTNNFYKSARDCPAEICGLLDELTSFEMVLESLHSMVEKANGIHTKDLSPKQNNQKRLPATCKLLEPGAPLEICHRQMIEFKKKLLKEKTKVRKVLKWPFQKGEIYAVIERLRNIQSILNTAITSDSAQLNIQIQDSIAAITASLDATKLDSLSKQIVTWLAAPDPSSNYNSAREKHHSDTGQWLLDDPSYLEWKHRSASLLWLHGKAGCGKTVLSSTVIHDLSKVEPGGSKTMCLYFYFDFQVGQKQTFESCLCSLLVQLISRAPKSLVSLKQLIAAHDKGRSTPSRGSLLEALHQAVIDVGAVYLVLDALDECSNRSILLQGLQECRRWGLPSLHILTTSRKETDIEDHMIKLAACQVCLEESVVDSDIRSFVQEQIQKDSKLSIWPSEIRAEIQKALLEGANGMFRWVVCQLDVIRECKKTKLLRRALKTLPKTLDETYERVLSNIPDDYVEDVRRVLQCLICAFEPLDILEVAEIVAIDTAEPYYHPEDLYSTPRGLVSVCSGLVSTRTSKRRGGVFASPDFEIEELRLAHFSVKEYLVSDRVSLGPASRYKLDEVSCHEAMADLCISYLLQYEEDIFDIQSVTTNSNLEAQESGDEQLKTETVGHFQDLELCERSPFAPYAAMFWSMHLRAAKVNDTTPLYAKSMKLVANPALLDRIVEYHRCWFEPRKGGIFGDLGIVADFRGINLIRNPLDASISPVYYASLLGLDSLVSQLLEAGESADSVGPSGTALAVAARCGHKCTVKLLLKMGANVNGQEVWEKGTVGTTILSRSALHSAIEARHEDIADILLDHGAAVNTNLALNYDSDYDETSTPLEAAVLMGSTSLVQKLLDRGADATVAGEYMSEALDIACEVRKDAYLARLLLEKGADSRSPQHLVHLLKRVIISRKNESLQELLVEYGADVTLVNFDSIRSYLADYGNCESEIEDYIAQTKARLAQVERRPKRSVVIPDNVKQLKEHRHDQMRSVMHRFLQIGFTNPDY